MSDFKVIVISPPSEFPHESSWVNLLFENGLEYYHLRKKECPDFDIAAFFAGIDKHFHHRIALHGNPLWLSKGDFGGFHGSLDDQKQLTPDFSGRLSSNLKNWKQADDRERDMDYYLVSPVFDSISKPGYRANNDLLHIPHSLRHLPLVALGGVNALNTKLALRSGYQGVALLGTIWNSGDPLGAFLDIQQISAGSHA